MLFIVACVYVLNLCHIIQLLMHCKSNRFRNVDTATSRRRNVEWACNYVSFTCCGIGVIVSNVVIEQNDSLLVKLSHPVRNNVKNIYKHFSVHLCNKNQDDFCKTDSVLFFVYSYKSGTDWPLGNVGKCHSGRLVRRPLHCVNNKKIMHCVNKNNAVGWRPRSAAA